MKVEQKATFTPAHTERQIRDKKLLWLEEDALLAASEYGEKFDNADEKVPVVIVEELNEVPTAQDKEQRKQRELPLTKMSSDFINPSITPETHLVYALTWASLAAIGSVMTFKKFRGSLKKTTALNKVTKS